MILSCFGTFLDPFRGRKCLKMSLQSSFWALIWPKIIQNRSKISLGPPKGPQGRQRPPRGLQAWIWEPFGLLFGAFWGAFSNPPEAPFWERCYPPSSPSFLASFHFFLPHSFVPLLPASPFFPPGNKDTKKPRTQATEKRSNPETKSPWVGGCPR